MAKQSKEDTLALNINIKEVYKALEGCPGCQEKVRKLIRSKLADKMDKRTDEILTKALEGKE